MTLPAQSEFPPLLSAGFLTLSVPDLRQFCVGAFVNSKTRAQIMDGLEQVIAELQRVGIKADIWVNGSFLTQKDNPNDADIVLCLQSDFADNCTPEQQAVLKWVAGNLKTSHHCDSYVLTRYPSEHPHHWAGEWMYAYWLRQFGFSRQDKPKGLALVQLT